MRLNLSWEDIVEYGITNSYSFGPLENRLKYIHPGMQKDYILNELIKLACSQQLEHYNTVRNIFLDIYNICKANNDDHELLEFIDYALACFILQV